MLWDQRGAKRTPIFLSAGNDAIFKSTWVFAAGAGAASAAGAPPPPPPPPPEKATLNAPPPVPSYAFIIRSIISSVRPTFDCEQRDPNECLTRQGSLTIVAPALSGLSLSTQAAGTQLVQSSAFNTSRRRAPTGGEDDRHGSVHRSRSSSEHGECCVRACVRGAWSGLLQLDHAVPAAHVRQIWKAYNRSRRMPRGTPATTRVASVRTYAATHVHARKGRQARTRVPAHAHAHSHEHARAFRFVGCTQADPTDLKRIQ